MKFSKKDIENALKTITAPGEGTNMIDSKAVKNIMVFDDEVVVDITITNPSLQAKKRTEVDILKTIHEQVYPKAKIQVNVTVNAPTKAKNEIKGKPIPGIQNIVAVASGKGGVGKSTITSNIAVSLAKMGFKVGILDADIYGPSIPIMFDVANEKPLAAQVDGVSKMQPIEAYGVKILSIGFFTKPNQAVVWRGPMAAKALNQMIFDAAWGELDFLLIDLPPGTGDIQLSLSQYLNISGAVIVSTPQEISLIDVRKAISMFEKVKIPILGLVQNMSYLQINEEEKYIFGKDGVKNEAEKLKKPFLGDIPIISDIASASDKGIPVVLNEKSEATEFYKRISKNLLDNKNKMIDKKVEIEN